jgi:hypothetical protein
MKKSKKNKGLSLNKDGKWNIYLMKEEKKELQKTLIVAKKLLKEL